MFTSTSPFISSSKKAIFAGLISATVAGATLIGAACPALASTRGWIHEGNTWSYQVSKDTYAKGWYYTPSGKWFFFDSNYKMVTGKVTDDNKDYWLDENAGILYNSWIKTKDGSWMRTNDKGILVTGWYYAPNGRWWYFNQDNHKMVTGKVSYKGQDYWLDENVGLLYNSWAKDAEGSWIRTNDQGILVTGWYYAPNGRWWYFNQDNHKMVTGKVSYKGQDYWLDENVGLLYNSWAKDAEGSWIRTNDQGILVTGWYYAPNGRWWYFNQDNHKMVTGKVSYKGQDYWLDENVGLLYNSWAKDAQGNWLHTNDKGILVKGWYQTSNGKWFYFNDDYTMKVGELKENGKIYTLDVNQGWVATRTEGETPSQTQSSESENTQSSESTNQASSSSTGRILGTDKNHKPDGATRWVVDKPAQTVKVVHMEVRYMNGHVIARESSDPKDMELVTNWEAFNFWKEHKNEMRPSFQKMTEDYAFHYYSLPKMTRDVRHEAAEYERTHKFKPGEPANSTDIYKEYYKTIPEQGHWE